MSGKIYNDRKSRNNTSNKGYNNLKLGYSDLIELIINIRLCLKCLNNFSNFHCTTFVYNPGIVA